MPSNTYRRHLAEQRRLKASELRAQGLTEQLIADELKISQQAVSKLLDTVSKRTIAKSDDIIRRIKTEHAEQLFDMYREARMAWTRSKDPAKSITKRGGGDGGAGGDVTQVLKDQDGDPRYLTTAQGLLADIRKIWGADAPVKTDFTSGGKAVTFRVIYDDEPDSGIPDTSTEAA